MKEQLKKITSNPIGSIVGAGAGWVASSKVLGISNLWLKLAVTAVGAIGGAMVQQNIKAKKSAPTAETVKK